MMSGLKIRSTTELMITILLRALPLRLGLISAVTAALLIVSWFITRAAIGDSIATFAQRRVGLDTAARLAGADSALRFASSDPLIHYRRGRLYLEAAEAEAQLNTSVAELRTAAQMSPEDYRIWLVLGRALERNGAKVEARAAIERAVRLAPHHFEPYWVLGNYLLRAGAREEAFANFRTALANRPSALPLIFNYAWDTYNGDGRAMANALSPTGEARRHLITLLIWRGRTDDALALWREAGTNNPADADQVAKALIDAGRYGAAYEVWRSSVGGKAAAADEGSMLSNGSFERPITLGVTTPFFTWRITPNAGVSISLDSEERRSGAYSLRMSFDVKSSNELTVAAQTAPVMPATAYRLSFAAKTDRLQSLGTPPLIEVYDAANYNRMHVASEPLPVEKTEWGNYTVNFTTSPATEAVTVRIKRPACPESPCPLQGRVWFDDFKLSQQGK